MYSNKVIDYGTSPHPSGPFDPAGRKQHTVLLRDLCDAMAKASLCAMGGLTPMPVLSALNHFPEDSVKG